MRRIAQRLLPSGKAVTWVHRSMHWFDRWCASRLDGVEAKAVVCYENAALHTFRAAHMRGITTILDAASFHHSWQDRYYDYPESDAAHEEITAHKEAEIAEADYLLTVSDLARESYIEAGVPPRKVKSLNMGASINVFSNDSEFKMRGPFTFIFAGHARPLKGIDLLLDASRQVVERDLKHKLVFAGGMDRKYMRRVKNYGHTQHLGHLTHKQLGKKFASADCLVLPSLFDSFGRVVIEAMASGLPTIVGSNVGARDCIVEGENGWIVESGNRKALLERMIWCIENREELRSMRPKARSAAEEYSWASYREKAAHLINAFLKDAGEEGS